MPTYTLAAIPAASHGSLISCSSPDRYRQTPIEAADLAEIRVAVAAYGAHLHDDSPEASFLVSVTPERGSDHPEGFCDARWKGSLGTEQWIRVIPEETPFKAYLAEVEAMLAREVRS
ncbi:hypothetical protein [Gluconobacter kondonii]|uniref:hypothetical protein n=1 Tax=Gluconobacter kondonii TaxID=941463 RepID=UPI001B8D8553|nr:hypothetical protein [Gluconobacter kondonii]MBS1084176.1 hypothetical protein [Gluconobacter kondonii]